MALEPAFGVAPRAARAAPETLARPARRHPARRPRRRRRRDAAEARRHGAPDRRPESTPRSTPSADHTGPARCEAATPGPLSRTSTHRDAGCGAWRGRALSQLTHGRPPPNGDVTPATCRRAGRGEQRPGGAAHAGATLRPGPRRRGRRARRDGRDHQHAGLRLALRTARARPTAGGAVRRPRGGHSSATGWRRQAGAPPRARRAGRLGFYRCSADLEDELIRALGAEAVEAVIEAGGRGALAAAAGGHARPARLDARGGAPRFFGSRSGRKARYARCWSRRWSPTACPSRWRPCSPGCDRTGDHALPSGRDPGARRPWPRPRTVPTHPAPAARSTRHTGSGLATLPPVMR